MAFNKNLQKLMNENNISRKKLASELNVAYTTVTDWINGKTVPRNDRLKNLATFFHTTVDDLLSQNSDIPTNIISIDEWEKVPIVGTIACGMPILATENIEGYQLLPSNLLSYKKDLFILKCKGDSMQPTIKNGSLVVIHQQPFVEDNEIAAVLINDEATLKRIKHSDDGHIILIPDNRDYNPIILDQKNDNRIIGKAINILSQLN